MAETGHVVPFCTLPDTFPCQPGSSLEALTFTPDQSHTESGLTRPLPYWLLHNRKPHVDLAYLPYAYQVLPNQPYANPDKYANPAQYANPDQYEILLLIPVVTLPGGHPPNISP